MTDLKAIGPVLLDPPPVWSSLPAAARDRVGFLSTWRGEQPGVSCYAFNLGLHVGDDPQQVLERRRTLAAEHGIRPVWMQQVHGTACAVLSDGQSSDADALTADAAFSRVPGLAPVIMTADCLPVLMTDAGGRAVAAAHCGWRGLLDGVLDSTLDRFLADGLGDGPLHAWLGPCIGPNSFEVGAEVRDAFIARCAQWAAFFTPVAVNGKDDAGRAGKWMGDLAGLATAMLQARHPVMVDIDGRDTHADPQFNSFRRERVTGRQATLIWLKA